jgi:hypothetical protein
MASESLRERDENLLVVAAVQGYSSRHAISDHRAFELLRANGVLKLIREHYSTLHTQSLSESAEFAEDVMRWKQAESEALPR